jgi:aspartyl protease family protein
MADAPLAHLRIPDFLLLGSLLAAGSAAAAAPVEVLALFKDRAVLRAAGAEHLLRAGETSPDGVTLIEADADGARVRYLGEEYRVTLSRHVAGTFLAPERQTVAIPPDPLGQYRVRGAINGTFVDFLVDTGASVVALSRRHARTLGLELEGAEQGLVQTAQGRVDAYFVNLNEVVVGGLTAHNVQGAVIDSDFPVDILLGMSFLRHVGLEERGGVLTLLQR